MPTAPPDDGTPARILLVDDARLNQHVLTRALAREGHELELARNGEEALVAARAQPPDLVLLDIIMPGIDGFETCRRLLADPVTRPTTVLFMSALDDAKERARGLELGAADFLTKPLQGEEVRARVRTQLRLRRLERELSERNRALEEMNRDLERKVKERSETVLRSRDAVIFGLAKLAESRDGDTGQHLERICRYVEILVRRLAADDPTIDETWIRTVTVTAALHDIGKVGVPDAVLCKPGRLTEAERRIIQRHTTLGGDTLLAIKQRWGDDTFLVTATQIAFGHHERWDGGGYPFGLAGEDIPLSARVVAVADVYDALTSPRAYKDAMPHEQAAEIIREGAGSHFDPRMVEAFLVCGPAIAAAARELHDDASVTPDEPHDGETR